MVHPDRRGVSPYRIDFGTIPWESPAPGMRHKAFESAGRTIRLLVMTREFVEHGWCHKGHVGYVVEGTVEIDFDGEPVRFGKGDGLFVRAGEKSRHKAKALTDEVTLILFEEA